MQLAAATAGTNQSETAIHLSLHVFGSRQRLLRKVVSRREAFKLKISTYSATFYDGISLLMDKLLKA